MFCFAVIRAEVVDFFSFSGVCMRLNVCTWRLFTNSVHQLVYARCPTWCNHWPSSYCSPHVWGSGLPSFIFIFSVISIISYVIPCACSFVLKLLLNNFLRDQQSSIISCLMFLGSNWGLTCSRAKNEANEVGSRCRGFAFPTQFLFLFFISPGGLSWQPLNHWLA